MVNIVEAVKQHELERASAGRRLRYPAELKRAVAEHCEDGMRRGEYRHVLAEQLGLDAKTIDSWRRELREKRVPEMLRPVAVKAELAVASAGVVVHTPRGLRIEGLSMVELGQLLMAIG